MVAGFLIRVQEYSALKPVVLRLVRSVDCLIYMMFYF